MEEKKKEVKGIKILTLSVICAAISFFLIVFAGINLYRVVWNYKNLVKDFQLYSDNRDDVEELQNASGDLITFARLFVVNEDPTYMKSYFEIIDNKTRGKATEKIKIYFSKMGYANLAEDLDKTYGTAKKLVDYEIHSMKLISQVIELDENELPEQIKEYKLPADEEKLGKAEKRKLASSLIFSKEYWEIKKQNDSDIGNIVGTVTVKVKEETKDKIQKMWNVIYSMVASSFALIFVLIGFFALNLLLVIRPIRDYIQSVKENRLLNITGSYEFKYLALTYNEIFKINQENKEKMSFELEHDSLTNVYSRHAFEQQKKLLSQIKMPMGLLICDIDKFKEVNDQYGHDIGDQALIKVASILKQSFSHDDIVARIGGDEFVVILKSVNSDYAHIVGKRIDKVNEILQNSKKGMPILSISVGIAFSENGYSEELFKQADQALYNTKENGRCGYSVFTMK